MHDFPIATIPDELRMWIDRGWQLGSYHENYVQEDDDDEEELLESETLEPDDFTASEDEWDDLDKLPAAAPRRRPREFNRLMKALVREMANLFNNRAVAYAMDKTGRYFTEDQLKETETATTRKWRDALATWRNMSMREQITWHQTVTRRRPLSSLI